MGAPCSQSAAPAMSQLVNPTGPEANNLRAAAFEDQVVSWMVSLGWEPRCRNIDLFAENGHGSKGVDVLAALQDPQLGHRVGLIGEAKIRHPLRGDRTQKETAALAGKLAALTGTIPRLSAGEDITVTRIGMLVYDAHPYSSGMLAEPLSTMQLAGTTRSEWPREVWAIGPDTLVGMADAFSRCEPHRFFWPPFGRQGGRWSHAAPPHQVAAGLLAWKDRRGRTCLWVRDPLPHDEDFPEISSLLWEWQLNVQTIICSSVSRDHWRTQAGRWDQEVKKAKSRGVGRLPETIEARDLSWASLTPWVDRWGARAA